MPNGNFDLDVDQERKKLNTFFTQRACLSGYTRHVLDTILMDSQFAKRPRWYPTLASELAELQTQAEQWFDTVAPPLTQLPQSYINVANVYKGQLPQLRAAIENLIGGNGSNPSGAIQAITAIFNHMLKVVRSQNRLLADTDTELKTYGGALTQAVKAMTDGAASVNAAITEEKEAIVDCKNSIAALQSQLESDTRALIGSAVTAGVGVGAAVVGS